MEKNIEHILNTTRPELTPPERVHMWEVISLTLTPVPVNIIPSPFYRILHAHRSAFALASIVVILMSGSATVVTAEAARPGDALFPLDQAIESVRLRLARNDDDRGRLANTFAEERLGELRSIVGERAPSTSETTITHDNARVGTAIDALMRVMDESEMSDTAREQLYTHLFTEIDALSIDVQVEDTGSDTKKNRERVKVQNDDSGSKIEIRTEGVRMRIEKEDGEIRIKKVRDDSNGEGEDIDDDLNEKSEVRGIKTDSHSDSIEDKKGRSNDR